jgi:uncharacterized protein YjiK
VRRLVLLALAAAAAAQGTGRTVEQVLADHVGALGAVDRVRTLVAYSDADPVRGITTYYRLPDRCRRDLAEGWREYFGPEGAFVARGLFERYRPNQLTTRGSYFLLKATAELFPLLAYARDPALRALLSVGRAEGHEVLFTVPDANGIRTVFLLDAKSHLLDTVRFEEVENRPFASVRFTDWAEVDGVMLPHSTYARLFNVSEDMKSARLEPHEEKRADRVRRFEVNRGLDEVDLVPPGVGGGGGQGFERLVLPTGPDPADVAVGDLDGDGRPDVAVACEGGVFVHFGGREQVAVRVPLGRGHHRGLAIDDFDADGRLELLTASNVVPDRTYYFVGFDRDRKPRIRDLYGAPGFAHAIVTEDLDLDGLPDVVATGYASQNLQLHFCNAAGAFRPLATAHPLAAAGGTERGLGIAVGDIDRDGLYDIAVADGARVRIFRGESNLSFHDRIRIPEEVDPGRRWRPVAVAFADLDADGLLDLVIGHDHPLVRLDDDLVVLRNTGEGFKATAAVDVGERVQSVAKGHFDEGPALDLAATSFLTGELVILPGDGKGGLLGGQRFASGRGACRLAVCDWDGDGRNDVVVANRLDDTVAIFLNRRGAPRARPARTARAVLAAGPVEELFELQGLSTPYRFRGEFRLPIDIEDPSGIAVLGATPTQVQLVIVSDKRSALFRVTLDRDGKRLLVGPAIALRGLETERLDLEAIAWDMRSGNLFLGCEADSSIVRANLFGHVLGRAGTGIESSGNDGIEGVAFHRRKDGTPLLYVLRERIGMTGAQPPLDVYDLGDEPFALSPRHRGVLLPMRLVDQSDAAADGERLLVVSRLSRELIELRFDDDLLAADVKRASYQRLTDELLGLRGQGPPFFGNVEGVGVRDGDLFLLVDNNRAELGLPGRNAGKEGRLLWFAGPPPEAPVRAGSARVRAFRILVPYDGPAGAQEARARANELLRRARAGEPPERLAGELGAPEEIRAVEPRLEPEPGETSFTDLPLALATLLRNLDVGEVGLCEYHEIEAPQGWSIVWRIE